MCAGFAGIQPGSKEAMELCCYHR